MELRVKYPVKMRTKAKFLLPIFCLFLGSMFSACGSHPTPTLTPAPAPTSASTPSSPIASPLLPEYADFLTVKYDANGNQVWAKLYGQSEDSSNHPSALNLDNSGNVFTTGTTFQGNLGSFNTVKYDDSGKQLWVVSYKNALPNSTTFARATAVDNAGNIYVTGISSVTDTIGQLVTLKYNTNGEQVWVAKYSKVYFTDMPSGLVVDAHGNVFITGPVSRFSPRTP